MITDKHTLISRIVRFSRRASPVLAIFLVVSFIAVIVLARIGYSKGEGGEDLLIAASWCIVAIYLALLPLAAMLIIALFGRRYLKPIALRSYPFLFLTVRAMKDSIRTFLSDEHSESKNLDIYIDIAVATLTRPVLGGLFYVAQGSQDYAVLQSRIAAKTLGYIEANDGHRPLDFRTVYESAYLDLGVTHEVLSPDAEMLLGKRLRYTNPYLGVFGINPQETSLLEMKHILPALLIASELAAVIGTDEEAVAQRKALGAELTEVSKALSQVIRKDDSQFSPTHPEAIYSTALRIVADADRKIEREDLRIAPHVIAARRADIDVRKAQARKQRGIRAQTA